VVAPLFPNARGLSCEPYRVIASAVTRMGPALAAGKEFNRLVTQSIWRRWVGFEAWGLDRGPKERIMETEVTMTVTIKAHFDGKVIVPDEPVDLPVGRWLEVQVRPLATEDASHQEVLSIEEKLRRLDQITGWISGPSIPLEALRRENLYEERSCWSVGWTSVRAMG